MLDSERVAAQYQSVDMANVLRKCVGASCLVCHSSDTRLCVASSAPTNFGDSRQQHSVLCFLRPWLVPVAALFVVDYTTYTVSPAPGMLPAWQHGTKRPMVFHEFREASAIKHTRDAAYMFIVDI